MIEFIHRYLNGTASQDEVAELERRLALDAELRRAFIREAETDAGLREIALERLAESTPPENITRAPFERVRPWLSAAAAAVALLATIVFIITTDQRRQVATLVSSEDAAWESDLPTNEGSPLTPGTLILKSGIATIEFLSGAELVLEAPAQFELLTRMKSRLHYGAAVIEVPESAKGFVLETHYGYAVDHGTKFEVSVGNGADVASFSVISGEISVHHHSGASLRLSEDQASACTAAGINRVPQHRQGPQLREPKKSRRIRTKGYATSLIRNNDSERLSTEMLTLKSSTFEPELDRRSLFAFQFPPQFREAAIDARIRFYVVRSRIGFAAHLPKRVRFAVYGVTDESIEQFALESNWSTAPDLDNAKKLGTFEIPRSKQQGVVWFRSDQIVDFVKTDTNGWLSFVLVRETNETQQHGLVHAFAADSHPDGAGPVLELTFDQPLPFGLSTAPPQQ